MSNKKYQKNKVNIEVLNKMINQYNNGNQSRSSMQWKKRSKICKRAIQIQNRKAYKVTPAKEQENLMNSITNRL